MGQRIAALGLDVGRRRIGIAGCDGLGLCATGLTTLERTNFAADVAAIGAIAREREVSLLVIGLPYLLNGELGSQAKQVQRFAQGLSKALGLPVVFVDERLTSVAAEELIQQSGRSPRQDKGLIDRKAAALILQQWLDEQHHARPATSEDSPDGRCAYLEDPR